jgi:hypothetical protein
MTKRPLGSWLCEALWGAQGDRPWASINEEWHASELARRAEEDGHEFGRGAVQAQKLARRDE